MLNLRKILAVMFWNGQMKYIMLFLILLFSTIIFLLANPSIYIIEGSRDYDTGIMHVCSDKWLKNIEISKNWATRDLKELPKDSARYVEVKDFLKRVLESEKSANCNQPRKN